MDALRYADAQAVLTQLGPLGSELVLIGGQAVNYWAEAYAPRAAELQQAGPFASKDVDFCGNVQQAEECARRLHGRCLVATPDDLTRRTAARRQARRAARAIRLAIALPASAAQAGFETFVSAFSFQHDVSGWGDASCLQWGREPETSETVLDARRRLDS